MKHTVEVKICGLTSVDDARAALDGGADYLGFVLYPQSPRYITPAQLVRIANALPASARVIPVFVNESRAVVEEVASDCRAHAVQLHGDEADVEFMDMPLPVWRAVWRRDGRWSPEPGEWAAARYVVDAAARGVYGGAGLTADWPAAAELSARHPVMLAGGLTPENVGGAVRAVKPLGVDVVSGVEASPGKKDLGKLESFFRQVRANE